ncbi:MAG TPA: DUF1015 family protein, partial [Actinophytocola sp.]|uniref:DUF1015 family protein n=1 Tax=Actinophytocola sp. TaxID=1872138 RepID=UPI002DDD5E5A
MPGPDVDEFAEPERIEAALAEDGAARRTLLAVQHPHRTPGALAAGLNLGDALPMARATLAVLLASAYRPITDVVAPYIVDGPDGSAVGLLCMVGLDRLADTEEVYPDVVADRAGMLAGLGCATSAAMLVPVDGGDRLTSAVRGVISGPAAVSTVDSGGRRHRVWLAPPDEELLDAAGTGHLLVADGNHRVAAAVAAGLDGLLALVTGGPDLRIGAFHRVLTGTGLDAGALAAAWRRVGLVVRVAAAHTVPTRTGEVVARCRDGTLVVELPPGPVIDHAVVEELLLGKALGVDPEGPRVRPVP